MRMTDEDRALVRQDAAKCWAGLDENQRTGVRFGMFPLEALRAAGYDPQTRDSKLQAMQHAFVCELMDCAKRDGGMRA